MPKKLLTVLLAALVALPAAACGGDGGGDGAGGSDDDALVVYSGRNRDLIGDLLEQYQRDTGRKLKVRFGESPDLAATLIEEGANTPADVFLSQDAGALGAVQKEGLLSQLPGPVLAAVDPRFRSEQGKWVGLTGRARVIAYDERELKPADLPRTVFGLTDDKWKGRVGWAPTNASFQSFVTALRRVRGEDVAREWLEGMIANDTKVYTNNIAVRDAIANGEIDAGLINHYYVAEAVAAEGEGYPVGLYYPPEGDPGAMVNVSGIGVLESTERRADARAFVRYLLGRDAQEFFARQTKEYPLASGVKPDKGLVPLDEIQQPESLDLSDLDDLQTTVEMLQDTGAL